MYLDKLYLLLCPDAWISNCQKRLISVRRMIVISDRLLKILLLQPLYELRRREQAVRHFALSRANLQDVSFLRRVEGEGGWGGGDGSLDEANGCIELLVAFSLYEVIITVGVCGRRTIARSSEQGQYGPAYRYLGYLTFDQVLALMTQRFADQYASYSAIGYLLFFPL
jgi:hypothetical protein